MTRPECEVLIQAPEFRGGSIPDFRVKKIEGVGASRWPVTAGT